MREFIKSALVNHYSTCSTDRYGQVNIPSLEIRGLFGEKTNDVLEFIKNDQIIKVSTYGNISFTYQAVSEITDNEIRLACSEALRSNPNYLRNINQW